MTNWKSIIQPANSPKYPTPEFIRIKLGLLPWDEYKYKKQNFYLDYYYIDINRNTGRTTKMLVSAIYYSQFRKVYVVGYNQRYTKDLIVEADRLCRKLNINPTNILPLPLVLKELDFSQSYVFFDHYFDSLLTKAELKRSIEKLSKNLPINWR